MKKFILIALLLLPFNIFSETISEIQGNNTKSRYVNKKVSSVEGIVTKIVKDKYDEGFYMQSLKFDNDENTSQGIYVDNKKAPKVSVGDHILVDGIVVEKQFGIKDKNRLTITSINANNIELLGINKIVEAVVIDGNDIPANIYDEDFNKIDRKLSAIDYFESLEGMLVSIKDPYITSSKEKYGDIFIIPKKSRDNSVLSANGGILYSEYGKERKDVISLTTKETNLWKDGKFINVSPNPGDRFLEDIVGVLTYDNFTSYKILPTKNLPKIEDSGAKIHTNKFNYNPNMLNVVTYNIENYSYEEDLQKTYLFVKQVKEVLKTPDIINLVEMGDDDGLKNTNVVSSKKNGKHLIDAIKKETGIDYAYVDVDPDGDKDGGAPGIHIRNAILYRTDKLSLKNENPSDSKTDNVFENGKLKYNPGRIGVNSSEFKNTRKPLVVKFDYKGKNVYVISLHLSSKRGDDPIFGINQKPIRSSEIKRNSQAKLINEFVKEIKENDKNSTILVMGDINDFNFSETTKLINGNELIDLVSELELSHRYTYVYEGMSQVLDNIMIDKRYKNKVNVEIIRVNSEFTKEQNSISDHDPIFIQFVVE